MCGLLCVCLSVGGCVWVWVSGCVCVSEWVCVGVWVRGCVCICFVCSSSCCEPQTCIQVALSTKSLSLSLSVSPCVPSTALSPSRTTLFPPPLPEQMENPGIYRKSAWPNARKWFVVCLALPRCCKLGAGGLWRSVVVGFYLVGGACNVLSRRRHLVQVSLYLGWLVGCLLMKVLFVTCVHNSCVPPGLRDSGCPPSGTNNSL